jgi:hypothetical protein
VTSAAASIRLCDKFLKDIDLFLGALTSKRIVCLPLPMEGKPSATSAADAEPVNQQEPATKTSAFIS